MRVCVHVSINPWKRLLAVRQTSAEILAEQTQREVAVLALLSESYKTGCSSLLSSLMSKRLSLLRKWALLKNVAEQQEPEFIRI